MRELLVVLNTRAQSFLKRAFEFRWQTLVQNLASLLIFGGFTVAVFFISRYATDYLINQAHIGLFLFHRFLSMLLFVFFVTVNVGNMIVSFGTLYRSQEVGFLMSLPISHAKIFLIKFVDNFFYSSSTLTLLGLAMLLGYGSHFDMPWYFYFVVMFFVMLPFMLIAGILAITTLMLLIQVGARIGFRLLLGLLAATYVISVYAYFQMTNPMSLVEEVMKLWPNVNEYLGYLDPPFVKILPSHWVAEFLYWSLHDDYARALPYFSLLLLTMFGLIALAGLIARKYYYESWLAVSDLQLSRQARNGMRGVFQLGRRGIFKPQIDVLLRRDVSLFFREPSQWLHLILMSVLIVMFLVSVGTMNLRYEHAAMRTNAFLAVFLFNGFLVASVALRFVFPVISLEGDTFWSVRTSPFMMKKLYWYKVFISFSLVLFLAEFLTLSSIQLFASDWHLTAIAGGIIFFVVLTLVGANVAAGGYFAMYREKNAIRIASSQGASLTFLGSMVYLTLVTVVLVVPIHEYFQGNGLVGGKSNQWVLLATSIIAAISILIFVASSTIGLKSIRQSS
jgi:ABC-2 type transport system permease protein